MTKRQIELIRSSFARITPIADAAGTLFYLRLFELDPSLKSLFKLDLEEQGHKLMQMIGLAVVLLDQPDKLFATIEALGRRHALYGVKDKDYQTVGEALIWTLKKALGDEFTTEVRDAWLAIHQLITSVMRRTALAA